jgi:hypothetical protein
VSFWRWYTTEGVPSEKTGKIKPFLSFGRRPPGESVAKLERGVFYRHPLYKDSHTVWDPDASDSLCGRPIVLDEMWWVDSGLEEAAGEQYLVVDQRKSGQCGPCKSELKRLETLEPFMAKVEEKKYASPFTGQDLATAKAKAKVMKMQSMALAAPVLRAFPGSEVVE